MPSVDVVSKVDLQDLDNAINNVKREVLSRYDFRGTETEIAFDRKAKSIHIVSGDDLKVKAIVEMLIGQCARFKLDVKCLDMKGIDTESVHRAKMDIFIREGISKDMGQKMVKLVKGTKLKVQATIQDNQVRLTGKKIDDLQEIMQLFREQDYEVPLQFTNMRD